MRIASMLSSATEIVYALGLEDHLVAISHECDYPPEALRLPRASRSRFDPEGLTSAEIDAAVRRCMAEHGSVYTVDVERLRELRPDVILTQAVCEVCAVPTGSVEEAVAALGTATRVVSLDAHDLEGILRTVQEVADAADAPERGREVVAGLQARLERVRERVSGEPRPRVLALEWLEPPFAPGHWIPEMVEIAGGESLIGDPGGRSVQVVREAVEELDPDHLALLPCGYDLEHARRDVDRSAEWVRSLAPRAGLEGRVWVGHSAYFSRSGPRVVEGIEALAAAFHPERFPDVALGERLARWPS